MNADAFRPDWNRREFLVGGSLATVVTLLTPGVARADEEKKEVEKAVTAVNCAVIGLGTRGREALASLAALTNAKVVSICDTYPAALRRSASGAPGAKQVADYKEILADKNVQAVIVCTPTHQHREITLAALAAGKHVYCEAPVANTIEDSKAIARAAKAVAPKIVFQPGLQERSHPQRAFLLPFIRSGALHYPVKARTQWHKKQSWRAAAANTDRERALNWRLYKSTSPGLLGEIGIHQSDAISWFLGMRPKSVLGFGSNIQWKDDREVADTVLAIFEYAGGCRYEQEITLANSFDGEFEVIYGTDAAVMLRENKAWMFKEADAALLGWEVYARKDTFYKDTGIALVANATKIAAQGTKPAEETPFPNPPLFYSLEAFLFNAHEITTAIADYTANFGEGDAKAIAEHLSTLKLLPAAHWQEGHEATVIALKANEAAVKGEKIDFQDEWFEV